MFNAPNLPATWAFAMTFSTLHIRKERTVSEPHRATDKRRGDERYDWSRPVVRSMPSARRKPWRVGSTIRGAWSAVRRWKRGWPWEPERALTAPKFDQTLPDIKRIRAGWNPRLAITEPHGNRSASDRVNPARRSAST